MEEIVTQEGRMRDFRAPNQRVGITKASEAER